ncbi:hypothetical protein AB0K18_04005 [Nonomuraea sp. NPDC049421]|uniref:hypothetical protein n=1 Tax=Nonomuraea sp. NPDC049421 TaxID=3155275 RepID=UPI00342E116B
MIVPLFGTGRSSSAGEGWWQCPGVPGGDRTSQHQARLHRLDARTDDANVLGSYLRARREQVAPETVGLPNAGLRRVPGLRREEVAITGVTGQLLVMYHAEPGTEHADKLALLSSYALPDGEPARIASRAVVAS